MLDLNMMVAEHLITKRFIHRGEAIVADNISAFKKGYDLGRAYNAPLKMEKPVSVPPFKVIDGNNALGIGLLGGGINYLSSYPMSPGTSVMMYLSNKADDFGVLVEQAEDEIAALNMALGASYAGARAMVTTSGGGFALMTEAVSLAGIIETPAVIHVAQRPGPATGLPTRTEQGDLNLVVYAGHGEFPRIVLAPGKLEDGVLLAQKAFWLADKYQVPVFILSDQYWLESLGQMPSFELSDKYMESFTVVSDKDYKRYKLTENGISPRAIPGFGEGFVKVDSDEHDESGQITEDFDVRVQMQDKRMKKRGLLLEDYQDAELLGPKDFKKLVVGWGSTYGVLKEFIETTSMKDVAYLYVKQPFPLPTSLKTYFDQAQHVVVVENNFTGQFANLLATELGVMVTHRVNKYNGEPFFIEEINEQLQEVLK
jgi:2-oxoglutarate ferredoxin oxidoreductase subunit alpha